MNRTLWNQGRVVGYSAYEIYVKQHLLEYPDIPPATEREWLAASLAAGTSMIVQLPVGYIGEDIPLPSTSSLAAANPIFASVFLGTVTTSNNWATEITDYGRLVDTAATPSGSGNSKYFKAKTGTVSSSQSFTGDGSTHTFVLLDPHVISISSVTVGGTATSAYTFDSDSHSIIFTNAPANNAAIVVTYTSNQAIADLQSIVEFAKIQDGVILQPGTISNHELTKPNFSAPARVRFSVSSALSHTVNVLLTGFTDAVVLEGSSGLDSNQSTAPQNGDFIGPAVFPQVAKMILCCPQQYIDLVGQNIYPLTKNVHVEKSADGVNIGIRVDNQITSDDTTLLTSTQTNDGGQTVLSVKPKKIVDDGLDIQTSGTTAVKVTKTTPSGKPTYTITDNLAAGKGIVLGEDTSSPKKRTISTNIHGGVGINIQDNSDGSISINSTVSGIGYTRLVQGVDYTVVRYNGFRSGNTYPVNSGGSWLNSVQLAVDVLPSSNLKFKLTTAQPDDWDTTSNSYDRVYTQPADWTTNYTDYYCYDSGQYVQNTQSDWDTANSRRGRVYKRTRCKAKVRYYYVRDNTQPTGYVLNTDASATWVANTYYIGLPDSIAITVYANRQDYDGNTGNRTAYYVLGKLPFYCSNDNLPSGIYDPHKMSFYSKEANPSSADYDNFNPYSTSPGSSNAEYGFTSFGFKFRHSTDVRDAGQGWLSHMFGVTFAGAYGYLNYAGYSFMDNSDTTTGIWNMYRMYDKINDVTADKISFPPPVTGNSNSSTGFSTFGASWSASCRLHHGPITRSDGGETRNVTLLASAGGYSDGYNSQFNNWSRFYTRMTDMSNTSSAPSDWSTKYNVDYYTYDYDKCYYVKNAISNWNNAKAQEGGLYTYYIVNVGGSDINRSSMDTNKDIFSPWINMTVAGTLYI